MIHSPTKMLYSMDEALLLKSIKQKRRLLVGGERKFGVFIASIQ